MLYILRTRVFSSLTRTIPSIHTKIYQLAGFPPCEHEKWKLSNGNIIGYLENADSMLYQFETYDYVDEAWIEKAAKALREIPSEEERAFALRCLRSSVPRNPEDLEEILHRDL